MNDVISELYKTDFNISKIFAVNQTWQDGYTFVMDKPRPTDGLLLFHGCGGLLKSFQNGEEIFFPAGTLVHIPRSSTYSWTFSKKHNGTSSKLFEFILTDTSGSIIETGSTITALEQPYPGAYTRLFDNLINEYAKPVQAYAKIKALAYELLSNVSDNTRNIAYSGAQSIYKGIRYLEDDPVQDKSIKDIAAMCNVSVNYFERLFKEYAGCTPNEYRISKRMEKAKILLEGGYMSIEQIATELGFADCAYFCRCFKKITGTTPTSYKNSRLKQ